MKFKKFLAVLISILIFLVPTAVFAAKGSAALKPTNDFFVNDFAGVMSSADKAEIMQIAVDLYHQTTAQIVVVTVESLNGNELEDYALSLGRDWGVGSKDKNNGVLVLLSVGDREITVHVGYGLESTLTDSMCGRLIDSYAIPHFKNNDFSKGLTELFKALALSVYTEYGVEPSGTLDVSEVGGDTYSEDYEYELSPVKLIVIIIFIIIVLVICKIFHIPIFRILWYMFISGGRGGRGGGSGGGGHSYHGGGGSFGGGGASRKF